MPEELQAQTGLYPGATFTLEPAEGGAALVLRILESAQKREPNQRASCR